MVFIVVSVFAYPQSSFSGNSGGLNSISNTQHKSKIDSTDLIDIFKKELNIKSKAQSGTPNKNGLGPYVSLLPGVGYAIASGYIGALASNTSFYTDEGKGKISSVLTGLFYSQFNQYWSIINSNIYVKKEKFNFVGDWRIYKFPTITFGLGSNSLPADADNIDYNYLKIYQVALQRVVTNLYFGPGYHLDYHSNIKEDNMVQISTEFQQYGLSNRSHSSGISLNLLYDDRANSVNPSNGTYCDLQYRQNYTFLGSDQPWESLLFDARKYIQFPAKSHNVLAFWSYNNFTFGNPPYLDLPSIGWDAFNNTGRGYAQGRFRGKNLIYLESEYRFALSRNGLFGGVVFANGESLSEWPANNFGSILPGYGLGIRIKVNKRSNTNLAIDYGFGADGSKGFYFNLGEVF